MPFHTQMLHNPYCEHIPYAAAMHNMSSGRLCAMTGLMQEKQINTFRIKVTHSPGT